MLLQILPSELNNLVFSYLNHDDLLNIEDVLSIKVNYEEVFRIKYNSTYVRIKKLFDSDKNMRMYRNMWELFYFDTENMLLNPITDEIYNKLILLENYSDYYKYIEILKSFNLTSEIELVKMMCDVLQSLKEQQPCFLNLNDGNLEEHVEALFDLLFYLGNGILFPIILLEGNSINNDNKKIISRKMELLVCVGNYEMNAGRIKQLYRDRWNHF